MKPSNHLISYLVTVMCLLNQPFAHSAESERVAVETASEKRLQREGRELKKEEQCNFLMNEMAAALAADDWENLGRLAKGYVMECKGVFGPQNASVGYENIAIANNQLGKHKLALSAANECIKVHYSNPGCHIQKAVALMVFGKKGEAQRTLDVAEKLARHALAGATRDRNQARSEQDKESHSSSIHLFEGQLNAIGRMQGQLTKEPE